MSRRPPDNSYTKAFTEELSYIRNRRPIVGYQSLDASTQRNERSLTSIMKVFLCLTLLVALTLAEPPRYRQQHQSDRNRYYFARQQQEVETPPEPEAAAPYPASGWKPDGPAFELPQRQQNAGPAAPRQQYGGPPAAPQRQFARPSAAQQQYGAPAAPQGQYGAPAAPQQGYGAPEAPTTTEEPTSPDFEDSTALPESQAEPVESVNELEEDGEVDEQQRQSGEYYVALPDGRLQRVQYMSSRDVEAMKYFAKIRAENVEPLRGPIYAYTPLQKLEFAPARLQVAVADPYVAPTPVLAIRENAPNAPRKNAKAAPEKLQQSQREQQQQQQQRQPLAAEVRYETPAAIVGLAGSSAAPVGASYATYTANYQVPVEEPRYLVTF